MPGDFGVIIEPIKTVKTDTYRDSILQMNLHTGTHIDTPAHMKETGKKLQDFLIEDFILPAGIITHTMIKNNETKHLKGVKALIIPTGHDECFNTPRYYQHYPLLPKEIIAIIQDLNIKMIILDTPSPDAAPYPIHHALFDRGLCIVENAKDLTTLPKDKAITIHAIPLLTGKDASPIRLFAKIS